MKRYKLSPNLRKFVGLCYKLTFILIGVDLVFFLAFIFSVIQGWVEEKQTDHILLTSAYLFGGLIVLCIVSMASYAIGYFVFLWRYGYRKEAIKGLVSFVFINILAGYILFYRLEIKDKNHHSLLLGLTPDFR